MLQSNKVSVAGETEASVSLTPGTVAGKATISLVSPHGTRAGKQVTRIAELPVSQEIKGLPAHRYQLNSAHHGIAINNDGTKLCVAATMSGYAAIVRRDTFAPTIVQVGPKPYWSTRSADGRECYVSVSEEDRVSVISFDEGREVARVTVGDHPQRVRTGFMYLSNSALTAATSRLVDRDGDHRRP